MKVNIFVSYCHQDARYLNKGSLPAYLGELEKDKDGVEVWWDKKLVTGDNWDEGIKDRIRNTHIALVLVSQVFLASKYCSEVEIGEFLKQRRDSGLIIFPVILSPCDWQEHEWLRSTQFLPKDGKTIEVHFTRKGLRDGLFLEILNDLREQIKRVRQVGPRPSDNLRETPNLPPSDLKSNTVERIESSDERGVASNASASKNPGPLSTRPNTGVVSITLEESAAHANQRSHDDTCRVELAKWVDKILANHLPDSGGFDWQILPPSGSAGGVWLQSQCLTGILRTAAGVASADKARLAFEYIQKLQKDDGGWAYSGNAKDTVTVTEVSCWVTTAYAAAAQAGIWKGIEKAAEAESTVERAFQHILSRRFTDGGWCPAGDLIPDNTRTYTTAMAIWCLFLARNTPALGASKRFDKSIQAGITWLLKNRHTELGWVPNPNRMHQWDRHVGLNSQVLFVLMQLESGGFQSLRIDPFFKKCKQAFLADQTWRALDFFQNSGIRDMDQWLEGPEEYRIEGSTFLWCPWTLAALHALSVDSGLSEEEREQAVSMRGEVLQKIQQRSDYIGTNGTYELAETIFCVAYALS